VSSLRAEAAPRPGPGAIAVWLALFFTVCVWSAIAPKDTVIWWLEASPALLALVVLAATWRRFPLTALLYWLVLGHSVVLFVGAHYTYAEVPLFDGVRDFFGLERNNYDKIGHFAQGFVPAIAAREILLRTSPLRRGAWLNVLVVCVVLAISASYELLEWFVAVVSDEAADAFLGTQGYVWDTQSDMLLALVGAIAALVLLSGRHDRELSFLYNAPRPG
jgi:putative membrane protein